jgi:hypothetical protein
MTTPILVWVGLSFVPILLFTYFVLVESQPNTQPFRRGKRGKLHPPRRR